MTRKKVKIEIGYDDSTMDVAENKIQKVMKTMMILAAFMTSTQLGSQIIYNLHLICYEKLIKVVMLSFMLVGFLLDNVMEV